jgi:D-psicose/D-tagatose/L-ribulose 3-epimerase
MQYGINTFLWTAHFGSKDFALLGDIQAHGFDGIEVTLIHPEQFEATAIRRELEKHQMRCTVCSVLPKELSLISDDATARARTVTHLSDCIKLTADAGANIIAGPLYAPVGFLPGRRRTTEEWNRAVEAYRQLGPVCERYDVDLCIEPLNRFETFFLNTTADAVALCDAAGQKRVGILWDTFHANIEEKNLGDALRSCARHLKHVHTCENDRGVPGSGHVDWNGVFNALSEMQYDKWLTIESFGFSVGDLSAAASIWRDLAAKPEQIAWEGIDFLKAHTSDSTKEAALPHSRS